MYIFNMTNKDKEPAKTPKAQSTHTMITRSKAKAAQSPAAIFDVYDEALKYANAADNDASSSINDRVVYRRPDPLDNAFDLHRTRRGTEEVFSVKKELVELPYSEETLQAYLSAADKKLAVKKR
jgi:hypothetical protein